MDVFGTDYISKKNGMQDDFFLSEKSPGSEKNSVNSQQISSSETTTLH